MKLVIHCRTCENQPFITWEKPQLTESECVEMIAASEHLSYECDIFVKLYDNNNTLIATVDEPIPEQTEEVRTPRWWEFWK